MKGTKNRNLVSVSIFVLAILSTQVSAMQESATKSCELRKEIGEDYCTYVLCDTGSVIACLKAVADDFKECQRRTKKQQEAPNPAKEK